MFCLKVLTLENCQHMSKIFDDLFEVWHCDVALLDVHY